MVDENVLTSSPSNKRRRSQLSSSSCGETYIEEYEDNDVNVNDIKLENQVNSMYENSTSSPESETNFSYNVKSNNDEKSNSEKKVHWNPSQVHALLDCIEKRIGDFKRKSVHKSVWISIGKEMNEHGDFSVEHCYNKWKNLRRDIRLFANSNNLQKLSIRNAFIMERVQKMVNDIGYEVAMSRKSSSSPISPNMMDNGVQNQDSHINTSNQEEINDEKKKDQPDSNNRRGESTINEETIVSLLSDPAVSQAILMNPKMIEEIVPGIDIVNLIQKIVENRPDLVASLGTSSSTNVSTTVNTTTAPIDIPQHRQMFPKHQNHHHHHPGLIENGFHRNQTNNIHHNHNFHSMPFNEAMLNNSNVNNTNTNISNSWPHQLYELLHSFRDEESRQMQRLDQIVNYVHVMQDSTKRRLNTINQLLSLAGLLIPQK